MKIFLLILVILYFYFFIFCNAQNPIIKLYDVSENTVDRYTKYPDGTTSTQCHFYFEILIVDTSKSGVGFIVTSSNPNPFLTTKYISDSAMVISTEPRVEQNGNYSDTVFTSFSNDSTIINNITINFSCQSIDFGDLTNMYFMANTSFKSTFGISGVFFFTTKYPITGFDITSTDAQANQIGYNSGVYLFNGEFSLDNFIEYNSVQINFLNGNNIEVKIPQNKYQNSNNNNTEIVTVPDINENINLFGKNTHPLFTLISNATDVNPFLFCLGSSGSQSIAQPIYQTNQGIKYLGAFNDYYSANYSVYLQLHGSLSIIYNATISVTREIPSPLYYTQFIITNTFKNQTLLKNSSIFNVHGDSIMKYDGSSSFSMKFGDILSYDITFPFGFINGTNFNYATKISLLQEPVSMQPSQAFLILNYVSQVPADRVATPSELPQDQPKILYFEIVKLFDGLFLFRITIANGFYMHIKDDSGYTTIGYESLVANGNGGFFFEFIGIYRSTVFERIDIFNEFGSKTTYFVGDYYSVDPVSKIYSTHKQINSYLVYNISFLKNDIDVTNKSIDNILYFNFDGIDNNTPIFFIKGDDASFSNDLKEFSYGKWNSTISKYQINFRVPGNTPTGIFPFVLIFGFYIPMVSDVLPYTSQLRIKNSYLDAFGPIFQTITKINNNNIIGWSFSISDPINGFLKGKIIVKGEMDNSIYIFNLNETNIISGDIYLGFYEINITIPLKCASQNYIITDVELFDRQNNLNLFSTWDIKASIKTPFFNFLNDSSINKIYKLCNGINDGIDSSPPVLKSFSSIISSSANLHSIIFIFEAVDEETGLKDDQFPIVYLTSLYLQTLECTSKLVSKNSTSATFSCEMDIPYGFGYNQDIIFSIYGFINNGGYFGGYSSEMLKNNSLLYSISDIELIKKLYIEKTTSITSNENELWIIGKQFNLKQTVHIKYYGDLTFTQISKPTKVYSVAMFINDIKLTDKPFIIKIVEDPPSINSESNEYIVNPIIYDYGDFEPTPIPTIPSTPTTTSTPTPTLLPTLSPPPTNKPQKCLGEPQCGGESHGYCSLTGCICYEPWVGMDCTSKVIIIPQPSINTTTPTTEIPIEVPSTGNNQTTNNIIFKSLLSIVSIRELDFQSKQVKVFSLERWIFKSISESKSQYISTIENSNLKTTITVHIEWFNSTTNISFANSQLTMNPSTVKYTIEISEYKFSNRLNQLQLVMSVSLETNKKSEDICSSSQFGESSNGDDSNYFKIQIDDHSLYCRFIKRAIIDSYVRSIENVLLDSSMETIKTPSSSQSYIGITIPIYSNSSIIDPDFSVLINSKSVTSDENDSICNTNPKSKLTTPQLAGIIIGSIGFVAVIIIAITYHFMKNRQNSKFFKSVGLKLKQLNQ
ncbi:hypothetical protein ACTFIW_002852 [Dictyostelium discoideum]